MVKGVGHESDEEQVLALLSLERRGLWRDLIALYSCQKGGCSQVGVSLLSQVARDIRKWPQDV